MPFPHPVATSEVGINVTLRRSIAGRRNAPDQTNCYIPLMAMWCLEHQRQNQRINPSISTNSPFSYSKGERKSVRVSPPPSILPPSTPSVTVTRESIVHQPPPPPQFTATPGIPSLLTVKFKSRHHDRWRRVPLFVEFCAARASSEAAARKCNGQKI